MNVEAFLNGASPTNFADSFAWQEGFLPSVITHVGRYLGPQLIRKATREEDTKEGTDLRTLMWLKLVGLDYRIAVRIRTPQYLRFGHEITITTRRETGAACEYDKVILGDMGKLFFYAIATSMDPLMAELKPRSLIDLPKARPIIIDYVRSGLAPERPNRDVPGRRCFFRAFPLSILKPAILETYPEITVSPTPVFIPVKILPTPTLKTPTEVANESNQTELNLGPLIRKSDYRDRWI